MTALYQVFGDESVSNNAVVYAVVVVPTAAIPDAEALLNQVKHKWGGSAEDELHCRELFAGHARKKTAWAHLQPIQVHELYYDLAQTFATKGIGRIISIADSAEFPKTLPAEDWVPAMKFRPKELIAWCGNTALIPLNQNPGLDKIQFWADPDITKIDWLGKKRQAVNALNMWVGNDGKYPERIKPEPMAGIKPSLLQVADFLAYVSGRALSREARRDKTQFQKLYDILNPDVVRVTRVTDGGFGVSVPPNIVKRQLGAQD